MLNSIRNNVCTIQHVLYNFHGKFQLLGIMRFYFMGSIVTKNS